MTPKGQAAMQYEQPLQMSGWMYTFSNSLWRMAPVGQACWQGAVTQCLQTSLIMSQRFSWGAPGTRSSAIRAPDVSPLAGGGGVNCSMNFTCRQDVADNSPVLS